MIETENILIVGSLVKDIIFGQEKYGGSAPVIASNIKGLGINAGVLSVASRDKFSQEYLEHLVKLGVNIELILTTLDELPKCIVDKTDNKDTDSTWVDNGGHSALDEYNLSTQSLQNYPYIHLVSCPPGLARRLANSTKSRLSYEPGPKVLFDESYFDYKVFEQSDCMFFNEEEYTRVSAVIGVTSPLELIDGSNKIVVITKGSNGSDIYTSAELEPLRIKAAPIKQLIDFTGAGDAYKSGFLAGMVRGLDMPQRAFIGSLMAAECIQQIGGILPVDYLIGLRHKYM